MSWNEREIVLMESMDNMKTAIVNTYVTNEGLGVKSLIS